MKAHALGHEVDLSRVTQNERVIQARAELAATKDTTDARMLADAIQRARRELGATPERMTAVLRVALALEGSPNAVTSSGETVCLTELPASWSECRRFVADSTGSRLTYERAASARTSAFVLHLDHPLFRRALSTLRAQLWRSDADGAHLHRVSVVTADVPRPRVTLYGRLVLYGTERNVLHEGLVTVTREISSDGVLSPVDSIAHDSCFEVADATIQIVTDVISRHLDALRAALDAAAEGRRQGLADLLDLRGRSAEKLARSLATERMAEIRRTVKEWEAEAASQQLSLFDDEERAQREQDIAALRARLSALATDREAEAKHQRALLRATAHRVDIVGLSVTLPITGSPHVA
jgi:hypothetical protein